LRSAGHEVEEINYARTGLTEQTVKDIVAKAGSVAAVLNTRHATAKQHGSFGKFLASWPETDQVGLMDHLKKNASRLGGATCQYFLRFEGWDAFILSGDVVKALIREGVVAKEPTSKKDLAAVQAAFNTWRTQTKRPVREISRILALSVG